MAVNSEKNYYINPKALSFTPNYQGYCNIVYVSIVSNAAIKAYHSDIDGLGYGMDAEYQTWRLSGTTTALGTASAYFIYARLSRTKQTADIIFSVRDYTVEGGYSYTDSEGNAQTVEKSDEYFYIKIGSLTATDAAGKDATVNRVLTYVSGELGTDKQINEKSDSVFEQMFEFVSSGVEKLINVKQPFKSITVAGESLLKGLVTFVKGFVLGDREVNAIATSEDDYNENTKDSTLPTTGYVQKELEALDDHFLIKDDADTEQSVAGPVTFEKDVTVQGDHAVGKSQTIGGNQTVSGTSYHRGDTIIGEDGFMEGLAGFGGKIDKEGRAWLRSLDLYESLTVPELRYNRVTILAGSQWRSAGGGVIESVVPDLDGEGNRLASGVVTLKLEDGEIGKIDVYDICMGVFHNVTDTSANETEDVDDGKGNFRFSGFFTAYFRVTEILDEGQNKQFRYVLRGKDDSWTHSWHPCAEMTFVAYGNFEKKERQQSRYSTTTYERYLRDVNTWEFTGANVAAQFGDLSNLSLFELNMSGYSAYLDNIYVNGSIHDIDASFLRMELQVDGYTTMAYGETISVECKVYREWKDLTDQVKRWKVIRSTANAIDDNSWGLGQKAQNFEGRINIAWTEEENDLGDMSTAGVSTLFTFIAYIGEETVTTSLEI